MSIEAGDAPDDTQDKICLEVPHVQQRYSWDCGLASTQMVLGYFGKSLDRFQEDCASLNFGTSVWTIDVAYLLSGYGINFTYTTTTLGVDKGYSKKSFYKERFTADEARVNAMFEQAYSRQIAIEKRSVDIEEIVRHLCEQKLAIILVDWNHLTCKWCSIKCLPSLNCVGRCLGAYQGHYIVLCGYNKTERLFYYRNPASKKELCCCNHKSLEAARKSYGTDEDIVFITSTAQARAS